MNLKETRREPNPDLVYLIPCSGYDKSRPRKHVYNARIFGLLGERRYLEKSLGWFTEEEAREKFGVGRIYFSGTDTLCRECYVDLNVGTGEVTAQEATKEWEEDDAELISGRVIDLS